MCCGTEFGSEIDWFADVVVALKQQGDAGGDSDANLDLAVGECMNEVCSRSDCGGCVGAHKHDPVSEPFGDAHAAFGRYVAGDSPELPEQTDGGVWAVVACEGGESAQVREAEGSGDIEMGVAFD